MQKNGRLYSKIKMCRYHSNISKRQLFKQKSPFTTQRKKNIPIGALMRFLYTKSGQMSPLNLHKNCKLRGTLVTVLKNCDPRHPKNILNTCQVMRMDAQPCRKSTFLFKHNTLLSALADGKSNVQVINTSLLAMKLKLTIYTKTKPAPTNVPHTLQFYRKLGGDKCRCHLRQNSLEYSCKDTESVCTLFHNLVKNKKLTF